VPRLIFGQGLKLAEPATWFPARRAAAIEPVEALRYPVIAPKTIS
jgi:ABC-type lipoprotein release transport system permease subunit